MGNTTCRKIAKQFDASSVPSKSQLVFGFYWGCAE